MKIKEITLPLLECERCGHKWVPRKLPVTMCPHCKMNPFTPSLAQKWRDYQKQAKKKVGVKLPKQGVDGE